MHRMRLSHEAIGVGMNTLLDDKPKLTCRLQGVEKNMQKIIITNKKNKIKNYLTLNIDYKKLLNKEFSLFRNLQVQSILIEGGISTFKYFLNCNLFDEIIVCQSNMIIKNSSEKYFLSMKSLKNKFKLNSFYQYGQDTIYKFLN